jgi:hypothetical protein
MNRYYASLNKLGFTSYESVPDDARELHQLTKRRVARNDTTYKRFFKRASKIKNSVLATVRMIKRVGEPEEQSPVKSKAKTSQTDAHFLETDQYDGFEDTEFKKRRDFILAKFMKWAVWELEEIVKLRRDLETKADIERAERKEDVEMDKADGNEKMEDEDEKEENDEDEESDGDEDEDMGEGEEETNDKTEDQDEDEDEDAFAKAMEEDMDTIWT